MTNYACPVCGFLDIEIFIEIKQILTCCNLLYKTRQNALTAPKADMKLGFCKKCGHVYNYAFNPDIMDYTQDYENSLHYSPRFQEYANTLAKRLISSHGLYDKDIIEIGCGKGDFLATLCKLGENRGIGFEPAYEEERFENTEKSQLTFIQDYYSESYSTYKGDIICCRHVLEHIQFPRDFLANIHDIIVDRLGTIVFFEVPNGRIIFEGLRIWDLIYEHCSYFCATSLKHLFTFCGFEVCRCTETFEGQFLTIEAFPKRGSTNFHGKLEDDIKQMDNYVAAFRKRYDNTVMKWQNKFEEIRKTGKRAVVWGAGSKGVTFLNELHIQDQVEYVVDINPFKQGKYIAGVGQKIVGPDFLKKYRPDIIIVMNSIYLSEIQRVVQGLGFSSEIITV